MEVIHLLNKNLLKAELAKNGITQAELCRKIGLSESTYIRKRENNSLGLDEIDRIIDALNIQNPAEIFLSGK